MMIDKVIAGQKISGEFIDVNEACALLERSPGAPHLQQGSLSLRLVNCDVRGEVLLIEGANGEFAVIKP